VSNVCVCIINNNIYVYYHCPSQVVYLRQRLDNAVSSSRDRTFSIEATVNMIKNLMDCDEFQDIATLRVNTRYIKIL